MQSSTASTTVLSRYFAEIRENRRLTKEEEKALARRIQGGDKSAIDILVRANLSFVVKVASEYRNLGIAFEDLLNEGNIGLIEAAHRFDADKDTKFISYAVWWIRKSMLKALADHSNMVRVPTHQLKRVREVRAAEAALRRKLGRKPTREEISKKIEEDVSRVDEVMQLSLHGVSIDEKVGKNVDRPLSDFIEDPGAGHVVDAMIDRQYEHDLDGALEELNEQERYVLTHRFGLGGTAAMTLHEIGKQMGVSRERVRQIENKATANLRKYFKRRNSTQAPLRPRAGQKKVARKRDLVASDIPAQDVVEETPSHHAEEGDSPQAVAI